MVKVFISQPMGSRSDEVIIAERNAITQELNTMIPDDDVVIIDSFFRQSPHHANPLWFLAKSLELLSTADAAYFADHWDEYRGCKIEHDACKYYNIKILHD
jgi:hypothetical protein